MITQKRKILLLLLIFIMIISTGFGCKCVSRKVKEKMTPIEITYWRVWDGPDAFGDIIAKYKQLHPFVTIKYRKLRYDEYEKELIEAFAADRGPDIFTIHNTWTRKYHEKGLLAPMPPTITMAYPIVKGSIKKEVIPEIRTTKSLTLKEVRDNFVDVVYGDVVIKDMDESRGLTEEKVYGLPLFVDTLSMFYNKDLFNNAGISTTPEYWDREFQQNVKKLTKQSNKGEIVQSGVALGGADNIERASDILSLLMMQNGTEMINDRGRTQFHSRPTNTLSKNYNPGLDALRFYTDFANPAKEVYSWNNSLENSLDMFIQNKLAIMFGYSYMIPEITARAPKLNYAVTKIPQIDGNPRINFANYWVEVVSKKSQHISEAWDFIQFATRAENVGSYLEKAEKPTALRTLVESQLDDIKIGVFAEQTLTAESWYKGYDSAAMEDIFAEMVNLVITGQYSIEDAIALSAQRVQQTLNINFSP